MNGFLRLPTRWAVALVIVAQTAALFWMIGAQVNILRTGRVVHLKVRPVDPRSLFRGDYVRLFYTISRLEQYATIGDLDYRRNDPIWVVLESDGEFWKAVSHHGTRPAPAPGQVVIKGEVIRARGRIALGGPLGHIRVRYGIESYFVPEGQGRDIEQHIDKETVTVNVAVTPDGKSAISAMLIEGKPYYREGLF